MDTKNSKSKLGDLFSRTLTSICSCAILAILIFFAEYRFFRPIFTAAVAFISSMALWEYYQLAKKKQVLPAVIIGIVTAVLYCLAVFIKTGAAFDISYAIWKNIPTLILGLSFFCCFVYFAIKKKNVIINLAVTFFGIVYIVLPLGLFITIIYFFISKGDAHPHFEGSFWFLYLIATTKVADMGGYFIGRMFGRRKLALKLSPNKTLEGAIGGLLASICMSLILVWIGKTVGGFFEGVGYFTAVYLGLLIGIFGQIGDLAESLLKRDVAVKDSNHLPGVGGILDMCDSLIFAAPIVYTFLIIHYG